MATRTRHQGSELILLSNSLLCSLPYALFKSNQKGPNPICNRKTLPQNIQCPIHKEYLTKVGTDFCIFAWKNLLPRHISNHDFIQTIQGYPLLSYRLKLKLKRGWVEFNLSQVAASDEILSLESLNRICDQGSARMRRRSVAFGLVG